MKNITVSVDDEIYQRACLNDAEQSGSLSTLFHTFLLSLVPDRNEVAELEFQRLQREEQELRVKLRARGISLNPVYHLKRDELYDRHALR